MFIVIHVRGSEEVSDDPTILEDLLDELGTADDEHPGVSVRSQALPNWSLAVFQSLRIVWEDIEGDDGHFHYQADDAREALELMQAAAMNDGARLEAVPWRPGYGT